MPARARRLAALALLACASACGSRGAPAAPGHGVLLVVVDALRADHLGAYGYDRDTSPALSALAREGIRFEEVFASSPQRIPAHVALMTGSEPLLARRFLPPEVDQSDERRWRVPERGAHLAVQFLAAGYATAAFVDHAQLGESLGFGRGFQRYEVLEPDAAQTWEGEPSTRIVERFLQWLRELPDGRPWFAYVHLGELERCWSAQLSTHESFFQPRPELALVPPVGSTDSVFFAVPRSRWRGGPRTLGQYEAHYDDEIRALDGELGRLFASLRRLGRLDSTALHVVGSFGMQLGEAGMYLSAGRYSRADLAVPWIYRPRGGAGAAARSLPGIASTLDVPPTLLALEGLAVPAAMTGVSQAALADPTTRRAAERAYVYASCGVQGGCAVIGERHVYEYFGLQRQRAFDAGAEGSGDAQQRRSWFGEWTESARALGIGFYPRSRMGRPPVDGEIAPDCEAELAPYRDEAFRWRRDTNDARRFLQAAAGRADLDAATVERLRARGYGGPTP